MLEGKKIILGITAGIAAYKSIYLTRLLVKSGAEVRIVMTPASSAFVSPLVLSTLSNNKVWIEFQEGAVWHNHVELGSWGDVFVIAPASCNTMAKMANGICDNILLATYLSARCPTVIVPAMDEDMYKHPSTQKNLETLISFGHQVIPVGKGFLASGLHGAGRMAEPEDICLFIEENIFRGRSLLNKHILITAGPTREAIDPVRFITNHSSGKMGVALAEACHMQGAHVTLIAGPMSIRPRFRGIEVISVTSAEEMKDACLKVFPGCDWCIMAAAVADFRPAVVPSEKISKKDGELNISWESTPDILHILGTLKRDHQVLIGFALETENEASNALSKLERKNLDFIVMNSLKTPGAGFETDTNQVSVFGKDRSKRDLPLNSKKKIAEELIDIFINKDGR